MIVDCGGCLTFLIGVWQFYFDVDMITRFDILIFQILAVYLAVKGAKEMNVF